MPLANEDDVRFALRRDLTNSETEWVDSLIDTASDLVNGYLHPYYTIPDPTPGPITRVVADMVAAVFNRPANILPETQSLSADSYGISFAAGATSQGPQLTAAFKERLNPFRTTMVIVEMASERGYPNPAEAD